MIFSATPSVSATSIEDFPVQPSQSASFFDDLAKHEKTDDKVGCNTAFVEKGSKGDLSKLNFSLIFSDDEQKMDVSFVRSLFILNLNFYSYALY